MSAVKIVKPDPIVAACAAYNNNPSKTVGQMVRDALTMYAKVAVRLHYTACFTLFHAAETGDIRPLNDFFKGLRQNDADALRIWIGKLCTFEVLDEATQETSDQQFIAFSKTDAFKVRKGTEAVRVGFFDISKLLAGKSFMDVDQSAEAKTIGLAEILAALARIEKQMTKKAEENDVVLPGEIKTMLTSLTNTAKTVGNTLGAKLN